MTSAVEETFGTDWGFAIADLQGVISFRRGALMQWLPAERGSIFDSLPLAGMQEFLSSPEFSQSGLVLEDIRVGCGSEKVFLEIEVIKRSGKDALVIVARNTNLKMNLISQELQRRREITIKNAMLARENLGNYVE